MKYTSRFLIGAVFGGLLGAILTAQTLERWRKPEVTAVVLVKPSMGNFVAANGTVLDGTWSKDEVVAMCPVKSSIGGFVPTNGTVLDGNWSKSQVRAVVFVQPDHLGNFEPVR
jgi:hypothetical protein